MDGSFLALGLRVIVSLAVVVGLLVLAARFARKQGLAGLRPTADWARVEVLSRQTLGRASQVAVIRVTGRVLLLGVTDQGVRVLTELEPREDAVPAGSGGTVALPIQLPTSLPATLMDVLRERTVRHPDDKRRR
jgi:flagellar biogenesis protein FliO